jgi:hypothetical protein
MSEAIVDAAIDGNSLVAAQDAPVASSSPSPAGGSLLDAGGPPETITPSGAWVNEKGEFGENWLDRLPADLQDSKQILGQFKDIDGALKTLVSQQRLLGKKAEAVLIPKDDASPEEVAAFRAKLGVPENADAYSLKPKDLPVGMEWNDTQAKDYNAFAHSLGLTPAQAEAHLAYEAQREQTLAQGKQLEAKAEYDASMKELAEAWGDKFDNNKVAAIRVAKTLGLDPNTKGLKDPAVVIALERVRHLISDDKIVSSDSSATVQVGKTRAMDIMTNPSNPMHSKYREGDAAVASLVSDLLKNG